MKYFKNIFIIFKIFIEEILTSKKDYKMSKTPQQVLKEKLEYSQIESQIYFYNEDIALIPRGFELLISRTQDGKYCGWLKDLTNVFIIGGSDWIVNETDTAEKCLDHCVRYLHTTNGLISASDPDKIKCVHCDSSCEHHDICKGIRGNCLFFNGSPKCISKRDIFYNH
jgi:hypothetical protein